MTTYKYSLVFNANSEGVYGPQYLTTSTIAMLDLGRHTDLERWAAFQYGVDKKPVKIHTYLRNISMHPLIQIDTGTEEAPRELDAWPNFGGTLYYMSNIKEPNIESTEAIKAEYVTNNARKARMTEHGIKYISLGWYKPVPRACITGTYYENSFNTAEVTLANCDSRVAAGTVGGRHINSDVIIMPSALFPGSAKAPAVENDAISFTCELVVASWWYIGRHKIEDLAPPQLAKDIQSQEERLRPRKLMSDDGKICMEGPHGICDPPAGWHFEDWDSADGTDKTADKVCMGE